jgi:hypothetical protein
MGKPLDDDFRHIRSRMRELRYDVSNGESGLARRKSTVVQHCRLVSFLHSVIFCYLLALFDTGLFKRTCSTEILMTRILLVRRSD